LLHLRYCSARPVGEAVEDYSNDNTASIVLVVLVRAVRAIYRSLPVPAACGL